MSNTIRIRTTPGGNDNYISLDLKQDFDYLEVLSLKVSSEEFYRKYCADYGAVVGRVIVNNGFGVSNVKVSLFLPLSDDDKNDSVISNLYPFNNVFDKDNNGIEYNLLPNTQQGPCHVPVGTFPNINEILDDNVSLEIFDKYYRYTTTTNESGDFMFFGIPVGQYTLHADLDISDIGQVSQTPYELILDGKSEKLFKNPLQFKNREESSNIPDQIKSFNRPVRVVPLWGDNDECETGITRVDPEFTDFKISSYGLFFGNIFTDSEKNSFNKNCRPTNKIGAIPQMQTVGGKIEVLIVEDDTIIISGDNKTYKNISYYPGDDVPGLINDDLLIDEDGNWAFPIKLNLSNVITDEYGEFIPSGDPNIGLPTEAKVRFKITPYSAEQAGKKRRRAAFLVPNMSNGFFFDKRTPIWDFATIRWKKIYSVRQYIPRIQKNTLDNTDNFIGIKDVDGSDGENSVNPFPYNRMRKDSVGLLFFVLCPLWTLMMGFIFYINAVIVKIINIIISVLNLLIGLVYSLIVAIGTIITLFRKLVALIPGGDSPSDIEFPSFKPSDYFIGYIGCMSYECSIAENTTIYAPGCNDWSFASFDIGGCKTLTERNKTTTVMCANPTEKEDTMDTGKNSTTGAALCCLASSYAENHNVMKYDFYNDWITGSLYAPLFKYKKKIKKNRKKYGQIKKEVFCDFDPTDLFTMFSGEHSKPNYVNGVNTGGHGHHLNGPYSIHFFEQNLDTNDIAGMYSNSYEKYSNKNIANGDGLELPNGRGIIKWENTNLDNKDEGELYYPSFANDYNTYFKKQTDFLDDPKYLMFATQVVELGSTVLCDIDNVPVIINELPVTSYKKPELEYRTYYNVCCSGYYDMKPDRVAMACEIGRDFRDFSENGDGVLNVKNFIIDTQTGGTATVPESNGPHSAFSVDGIDIEDPNELKIREYLCNNFYTWVSPSDPNSELIMSDNSLINLKKYKWCSKTINTEDDGNETQQNNCWNTYFKNGTSYNDVNGSCGNNWIQYSFKQNPYYIYFGLKEGKTALDKLRKKYLNECLVKTRKNIYTDQINNLKNTNK